MLVAIDTGGTKTLIALFNTDGEVEQSVKFPTPKKPAEYFSQVHQEISKLIDPDKISAIGLALPGILKDGVAIWCPNLGWKNQPILKPLQKHFSCPILIENDANLAGLSETRMLKKSYRTSLYITVSTGIGMGLIIDGEIHPALSMSEPGHMMIEYEGRLREWETFGSGRSIVETYGKYARDIHDPKIWRQVADKICRGMITIIPAINPEVIIIGGSIGTYFDRYKEPLMKHLREHINPNIPLPKIIQAKHPEEAVVYGCYYYVIDQLQA